MPQDDKKTILEHGANVVLNLRAEMQEARANLESLSGDERRAAEAALARAEDENNRLERRARLWQSVGDAIGTARKALKDAGY